MTMFKVFLDTSALIRLSGLEGKKLEEFRTRFNSMNAELLVTHVAVDEATHGLKFKEKGGEHDKEVQEYKEKIESARQALSKKGIQVKVETTNITVAGISRVGYTSLATTDIGKVYDELWMEIEACEKAKGRPKDQMNIKRDAVIAVSPLEYPYLITTDQCLSDSFIKTMKKQKHVIDRIMTPKAKHADPSPEGVADCILEIFSKK